MTTVLLATLASAVSLLASTAATSFAQGDVPLTPPPAAGSLRDCSRWPASTYDETAGACVCPQGMWWNLRGDACLPREHAAGEFCTTVWPGSSPYFLGAGGYRCVCAPPLLWDDQATACRTPASTGGEQECNAEWPGTLPVLSPSGTESECRCPGGRRWDEGSRSCVAGAPIVAVQRGFPDEGYGAPVAPNPLPPSGMAPVPAPGSAAPSQGREIWGADANEPGAAHRPAPPSGAAPGVPPVPNAGGTNCEALLAEIRARAQAGQSAQADSLGMRAAVAGCDPAAISEASRVP